MDTIRVEQEDGVFTIVLCRPHQYNTITEQFRDELSSAIDEAEADQDVRVILLRAEGNAFCAGYGLDWTTEDQASEGHWDSVQDMHGFIGPYVQTFLKLWDCSKPTVAAVQGWCLGGGTDMILCCDLVLAGDSAVFGYPPSRVYGIPTTGMWAYRMGLSHAKRYLFTGDEIPAHEAAKTGLILDAMADASVEEHARSLAQRIAKVPLSQLVMLKLLLNQGLENSGFRSTVTLGTLLDGVARHTAEGKTFVERTREVGWRETVRNRDQPFGDYGSRPLDVHR
jgi:enoyl-CoA hydratase